MSAEFVPKLVLLTHAQVKWLKDNKAKTGTDANTTIRLLLEREMRRGARPSRT